MDKTECGTTDSHRCSHALRVRFEAQWILLRHRADNARLDQLRRVSAGHAFNGNKA